jgi:hypothetical protein
LFRQFHIGSHDGGRSIVEGDSGFVRIRISNAHERRQAEHCVATAHPAQRFPANGNVLGIDEDEVEPTITNHFGPERRYRYQQGTEENIIGIGMEGANKALRVHVCQR